MANNAVAGDPGVAMQAPMSALAAPTIARRLISIIYETLLALAVLFLPLLLVEFIIHAGRTNTDWHLRQAVTFLVLGAYFVHQWSRDGQTLAMKTWRMKLVRPGHAHLSLQASVVRYLLSWMWVLPGALVCYGFGLHQWQALGAMGIGILAWAGTALLDKDRQFLHDKLTGTRLVQLPKPAKKAKQAKA